MVEVKLHLKTRRRPLTICFESKKQLSDMLNALTEEPIVTIGPLAFAANDFSYLEIKYK